MGCLHQIITMCRSLFIIIINIIIIRIIDKTLFSQENQFKYLLCK